MLGRFDLLVDGRSVQLPSKGNELIAFLALEPGRRASRQRISGVLWPDLPDERAFGNLNTTLWRLRKAVLKVGEPAFLRTTQREVGLDSNRLRVDYWEFERSVERLFSGDVDSSLAEKAVALFRGDLLEGDYEADWLLPERERIRLLYLRTLRLYADSQAHNGAALEALQSYERVLEADPLNEEVCREMMRLYHSMGKRAEAFRLFSSLSQRLRAELAVPPEAETRGLYDSIRLGQALGPGSPQVRKAGSLEPSGCEVEMVGRDAELRELENLLVQSCEGKLIIVGIEGEVGIGKTRLVTEFGRIATRKGCKVLTSRCEEFPKAGPYEALRTLFRGAPGPFSLGGREGQSPGMDSESRVRFFEGIASWLRDQVRLDPVVMILEDLQFSDSASLDLFVYLTNQVRDRRLMFVLTWRLEDCPPAVARLLGSRSIARKSLKLSRLNGAEVQRLCEAFLGPADLAPHVGAHVYNESEGNPLFALELLRSLENRSLNALGRGYKRIIVPDGFRAIVRRRLGRLPIKGRQLLQFASTCGRKIDLDVLMRSMNAPSEDILQALHVLTKAGFVAKAENVFAFVHDKIREVCYEELPPSHRAGLHRRVLDVLEGFYADRLDELAFHSEGAGDSERASMYWEKLGDRATDLWAHLDAASAYTKALENWDRGGARPSGQSARYGLLKKRALSWEHLGELEKGEADVREMLGISGEIGDEYRRCEALALRSRFLLRQGVLHRALDDSRASLDLALRLCDRRLETSCREVLALVLHKSRDFEKAEQEFLQMVSPLEALKDYETLERVWNGVGRVQAAQGRNAECLQSLDRAETYWTNNLNERALRYSMRGVVLGAMAKVDEAVLNLRLAERDFRRAGNSSGEALVNSYLSSQSVLRGDLAAAVVCGRKGLPSRCGKNDVFWAPVATTYLCHGVCLALGSYRLAKRMLQRSLQLALPSESEGNILDIAAAIALEEEDLGLAYSLAVDALGKLSSEVYMASGLMTLGRICLAQGHSGRAVDFLQDAVEIFERRAENLAMTQALSYLAIALKHSGSTDEGLACSRRAVSLLVSNGGYCFRAQEVYWNHFQILQDRADLGAVKALDKAHRIVRKQAAQLGRKGRARFLAVRVNREIVDAWEKMFGSGGALRRPEQGGSAQEDSRPGASRVSVLIPIMGAPWGRPLRANEFIEVIWTVDAVKADQVLMQLKGEVGLRRARILRLCAEATVQGGDPREDDLARALGVSTRTIRSDIAYLRSQGCSVQTRGGPTLAPVP